MPIWPEALTTKLAPRFSRILFGLTFALFSLGFQVNAVSTNATQNNISVLAEKSANDTDRYRVRSEANKPDLIATLAGLALAAAAILVPFTKQISDESGSAATTEATESDLARRKYQATKGAIKLFVYAFYAFSFTLLDDLMIDPVSAIGGAGYEDGLAYVGKGGLGLGIVLLFFGARRTKHIFVDGKYDKPVNG